MNVRLRRRQNLAEDIVTVAKVINCSGPDTDLTRVREPLIVNLREQGVIRPDPLGLGLDCDAHGAVISASGLPCRKLLLAGPLRKGQVWENTAVPELRIEAANIAFRLTESERTLVESGVAHAMQC